MSTCYGRLTGGRGSVTRTGSKTSGMAATVQTWDGALTVRLQADGSYTIHEHSPSNQAPHKFGGKVVAEGVLAGSPADLKDEFAPEAQMQTVQDEPEVTTPTRLRKPAGAPTRKGQK